MAGIPVDNGLWHPALSPQSNELATACLAVTVSRRRFKPIFTRRSTGSCTIDVYCRLS